MRTSDKGIKLIKNFEGLRLKTYLDAVGIPTVGYGHTGPEVVMGRTITEEEAEEILKNDLMKFEDGVTNLVQVDINQNQFDALVAFSFNVGLRNLKNSTLLRKLNAEDYNGAAEEFPRWNKAGGKVLSGLTKRRGAEKALFMGLYDA